MLAYQDIHCCCIKLEKHDRKGGPCVNRSSLTDLDGLLPHLSFCPFATGLLPKEKVCFCGACWLHKHNGDAKICTCTSLKIFSELEDDVTVQA